MHAQTEIPKALEQRRFFMHPPHGIIGVVSARTVPEVRDPWPLPDSSDGEEGDFPGLADSEPGIP